MLALNKYTLKLILVIFFHLTLLNPTRSQTFLLLDRNWHKSAIQTDTVVRENLSDGFFPIYKQDLDTLITLVGKFKNLKNDGLSRKFYYSADFKTERFQFEIENIKRAYGDGYEINLISKGPFGEPTLKLSDPRNNLPANENVMRHFLAYLKKTKENLSKPPGKSKKSKSKP